MPKLLVPLLNRIRPGRLAWLTLGLALGVAVALALALVSQASQPAVAQDNVLPLAPLPPVPSVYEVPSSSSSVNPVVPVTVIVNRRSLISVMVETPVIFTTSRILRSSRSRRVKTRRCLGDKPALIRLHEAKLHMFFPNNLRLDKGNWGT